MQAPQTQQRPDVGTPPAVPVSWLAETAVEGEERAAIVWAQHAQAARTIAAPVLEQPLHELVKVKRVQFKGFSLRECS